MAASVRSRLRRVNVLQVVFLVLVLHGAGIDPAFAQNLSSGSIDGVVTDDSGGALPGVAVTASSPALQIKQVSTVTDSEGRYRLLDLPRGTYQISFDLAGFQAFRREGLDLAVGFAARVNAQMKIGSLAEVITVSGASPVVDLTTTRGGTTISSDLLITELPGSKTLADVISLSAGLQSTAGEVAGSLGLTGRPRFSAYGLQ
ncbi:MAG: carboxypeptidase-like regulatory domain-containing protein, partial [Vicinamibacterales bacterium]